MAELSLDAYWQLPPIARTVATATFAISLGIHTRLISDYLFPFYLGAILRFPPQIWRCVTCFMITGPQLGILLDTYFMYSYMSQLERGRLSKRADLIWYLIFICGTILTLSHFTGFAFGTYTHPLLLAMCYTVTQEQRGGQTNYMFITIPSQLVPYAMLAFNLLFPNGYMTLLMQLHGLVAAHLYLFLTRIWPEIAGGKNFLATPALLSTLVGSSEAQGGVGAARRPEPASGRSSSASSGPLPDSWRTRGPGHRLG